MSWLVERIREPECCESLVRNTNAFVSLAYTRENTQTRRTYVYEYSSVETFAFAIHCPGSAATRHLPGFALDELPLSLATLTSDVVERMGISGGRVLFNVGRYVEGCGEISPHYDGELFDYTPTPGVGNEVRRGIRPRKVAIVTLRDETVSGGTCLHDDDGEVAQPRMGQGDLLIFDNTLFMHSAPDPIARTGGQAGSRAETRPKPSRWIRYMMGWRAFEDDCFFWQDGNPLRPVAFEEAIELHERFLAEDWPLQVEGDLSRATFPFPESYS